MTSGSAKIRISSEIDKQLNIEKKKNNKFKSKTQMVEYAIAETFGINKKSKKFLVKIK